MARGQQRGLDMQSMTRMAEVLRQARNARKLTQQAVAAALGVSRQTVHQWEQGITAPSMKRFSEVARVYGVTVDEMLGDGHVKLPSWIVERLHELGLTADHMRHAFPKLDSKTFLEILAGRGRGIERSNVLHTLASYLRLPVDTVEARVSGAMPAITGDVVSDRPVWGDAKTTLPVYAARDLGGGIMAISKKPIEFLPIPAFTSSTSGAFFCYVVSDVMAPAYRRGDRIIVNPSRPPALGDDVVLTQDASGDELHGMLCELVGITDDDWEVRTHQPKNPKKPVTTHSRKTWTEALRVDGCQRR